jgi:hypothetical protein
MGELLTILAIGLALEYLLGWAFDRKPQADLITNGKAISASPVESVVEIVGKLSFPHPAEQQRIFRIVSGPNDSPIAIQPYLPFQYGEPDPDWPECVCCGVELELERKTATQTFWTATYDFKLNPPNGFTSNGRGLSATEYAARLFSMGCLTANEVRQAGNLPQFPPMEDGCNV